MLDIFYYLFYRLAKFSKNLDEDYDLFWAAALSTLIVWNYITSIIEWGLGVMNISHTDWYYIIIEVAASFILSRYVLTEDKYTQLDEKYTVTPIKYKTFVDILIPVLFILSIVAQLLVDGRYDTRVCVDIRKVLFHH